MSFVDNVTSVDVVTFVVVIIVVNVAVFVDVIILFTKLYSWMMSQSSTQLHVSLSFKAFVKSCFHIVVILLLNCNLTILYYNVTFVDVFTFVVVFVVFNVVDVVNTLLTC